MDRRHFLKAATLGVLAPAVGAEAQQRQQSPRRVGLLSSAYYPNSPAVQGLKTGLREVGFEEGRDLVFETALGEGDAQRVRAAAAALVRAKVEVIFADQEGAARAAKDATERIPVVFTAVGDPVATGMVKSLAHPGANVTGVSGLTTELVPKRLESLKAAVPGVRQVWAVYDAADPASHLAAQKAASVARALGLELLDRPVRSSAEAIATLKTVPLKEGVKHGLLAPLEVNLNIQGSVIDISPWVPSVFDSPYWVEAGALMSYGAGTVAMGQQAARLVAKILRGERPQDLPVEGANRIELVINLKTAKQLHLTIPESALARADRLIRE
ncbi:MAG TPA: ABC transporter substrate binding protein [Methylomirabilota bacterium]|jgi:putative ABC transport system substrate-binding protein|nr:ABC transporter substrate binding protein [Methylomirabilota bacterium]